VRISLLPSVTLRSLVALSLAALLAGSAAAQENEALRIIVIDGDNARHNIRTHAVSPTVVEIRDLNNRPVAGAHVEFELPALGPGGHFSDGGRKLAVMSDSLGRAATFGFVPNDQEGQFRMVISAYENGRNASLGIVQYNALYNVPAAAKAVRPAKSNAGTKLLLLVVIGAAVAGGGIAASKSGSSSGSGSSAASVSQSTAAPTIGTITVGGPH